MTPSGLVWPRWLFWPRLAPYDTFWPFLAPLNPVWPCLAPFGTIWHHLAMFGPAWFHLALLGNSSIFISRYFKLRIRQGHWSYLFFQNFLQHIKDYFKITLILPQHFKNTWAWHYSSQLVINAFFNYREIINVSKFLAISQAYLGYIFGIS